MLVRVGLPQERQFVRGQQFRRALHHAQHVVVGHVEHFAHLQALGCEWRAVHGQTVRVGVHVVHRAHETAVRRVCGGAGDQVKPAVVAMFLKHARGAGFFAGSVFGDGDGEGLHFVAVLVGETVFRRAHSRNRVAHAHCEHLVVLLEPVLHEQQRLMARRPADGREIFVRFTVPFHAVRDAAVIAAVRIVTEFQQGEVHVGIRRHRLRIAASLRGFRRVGRVGDVPSPLMGGIEGFEQHVFGVGRPPEAVVAVHFLARGEFGEADLPFAGRGAIRSVRRFVGWFVNCSVDLRDGSHHGHRVAVVRVFSKIDVHQIRAGRVHDVPSVGADARIEHRLEFRFVDGNGARHAGRDIRQEQLAVDGERHAVAGRIDRIADDAGTTFTRTFAARLFLSRHILGVGVSQQRTRIGKQNLVGIAIAADHAHPQGGDGVLRTVRTQEQRTRTVADRAGGTWRAAGESQGTGLQPRKLINRIIHTFQSTDRHAPLAANTPDATPFT